MKFASRVSNSYLTGGSYPDTVSFMKEMSAIYPYFGKAFQNHNKNSYTKSKTDSLFDEDEYIEIGIGHYFPTNPSIVKAAQEALDTSYIRYTHSQELLHAIAEKYKIEQNLNIDSNEEIVLLGGARIGIALAFLALVNHGDKVIIPDPDYIGLTHMAAVLEAEIVRPAFIRTKNGNFIPDLNAITEAIYAGARVFAFTNPGNPTGHVWTEDELSEISTAAAQSGTTIIVNEVYDRLQLAEKSHICYQKIGDIDTSVIISGTAKNYDMTGFGLGWILSSKRTAAKLNDFAFMAHQSEPDLPSQYAALAALSDPIRDEHPKKSSNTMLNNAKIIKSELEKVSGCRCPIPDAGQFSFPYIGLDDLEVSKRLKTEHGVLVVPGSVWGRMGQGHLRIALASPLEYISQGLSRLVFGLQSIIEEN